MNATVKILMLLCEIMTIFSWFILKAVTPWLEEKLASKPDDTATHQTLSHIQHIGYQTSQKSNRTVSFFFKFLTVVKQDVKNRSKDISSLSSLNESDQGKLERLKALRTIGLVYARELIMERFQNIKWI